MSTIESVPPSISAIPAQGVPLPQITTSEPAPLAPIKPPRLASLDVFRGITIAAMLLVNNPGKGGAYSALIHAGEQGPGWNGWTPTDLIFPFFLFIVGVATPFSLSKRAAGESRGGLLSHIWARAIALFALGELLTGLPYRFADAPDGFAWINYLRIALAAFSLIGVLILLAPWKSKINPIIIPALILILFYVAAFGCHLLIKHTAGIPADFRWGNGLLNPTQLRIPGVLQRIGICYGVAATIGLFFGWRLVATWAVLLMAIYTALMFHAPFKGHETGSLSKEDNFARAVDEWALIREGHWNHAYGEYPDNEGIVSTLPSIASVLIGILVGVWLRTFRPAAERCGGVLVFGLFTLLLGMGLNRWLMPINKEIWTPSFTVFTAGMAMLCLGTVFYFVDVLGHRRWAWPFMVYGMNAIAAFVAASVVVKTLLFIQIKPAGYEKPLSIVTFAQNWCVTFIGQLDKYVERIAPHYTINTGHNTSLAYALLFVFAIFVLMLILYVCRIFVKV